MFEYNGKNYNIKFNIKRIEMIENTLKKSVVSVMQSGALSVHELKVMFAYGAIKEGANAFEPPRKALDMADDMLSHPGSYAMMSDMVAEAIERDCAFFFPAA